MNQEEPADNNIVLLEEALEGLKENPPDGFMINMVYYDTSVADDEHPLHMSLEMLKQDFNLELRKRAVQIKDLQYYQVDMVWFGEFKALGGELKRLDKILATNNNSWRHNGMLQKDVGMNVAFVMRANPDEDLF